MTSNVWDHLDSQPVCHLLRLSDEILLNIFNRLPVKARLNSACLHPRIRNVIDESWKHVIEFPSRNVAFRFHRNKKRPVHLEDYLPVVTKCKNLSVLRIPTSIRDTRFWREAGQRVGSHCPLIQRLVGQFNDIEFVLGIVNSLPITSHLNEVSIRQIRTVQDLDKLLYMLNRCEKLQTVRILINSLPTHVLKCADIRLKLKILSDGLKSFVAPESLKSHIPE